MLGCGYERFFEWTPALVHLAADDFTFRGVDEAEFADGETVVFVAEGWAEGTALDGASSVEVAGAGGGIEDGAGLVVGEFVEGGLVVLFGEEDAGDGVAWEVAGEAGACGLGAGADVCGESKRSGFEAGAEVFGVELRDGEDADAALVAAWLAGEPIAGAGGGGG